MLKRNAGVGRGFKKRTGSAMTLRTLGETQSLRSIPSLKMPRINSRFSKLSNIKNIFFEESDPVKAPLFVRFEPLQGPDFL